jgi:transcription-repair coupling factor (superfamily II helicase)
MVSQQAERLAALAKEQGIEAKRQQEIEEAPQPKSAHIIRGSLPAGWRLDVDGAAALSLFTDAEIFGFTKQRRMPPKRHFNREAFLAELSAGDYVVHIDHGIARFAGLVRKSFEDREGEYLELHYAEGDRLFVPTEQLDRISRYVGPADHPPVLTRLSSQEWARTKERVRRATAELARELLNIYAAREVLQGHAYSPDTPWQQELEAAFPYVETPDQLIALRDIKADMESGRPMDRLVCGDVGYGKTELAIRAAFKAVMDGRQVAVLVPTTVLAQQHGHTFSERLAGFPTRVEVLSRFRSEQEQSEVVRDLAAGSVDIIIGTHRLLQKDVQFKDLGLLIIDEEQRFGVAHKEHLKKLRQDVDVLTLSATPIPRTLYMALGSIRDVSTMETPPEERLPIKTYVAESDDRLIREAILREMERGGQVYFVHNRVQSIEHIAERLRHILPEASFTVAHGQMPEHQLEMAMLEFSEGKTDVLVCTTIIESGLDIPNVNTIIINQANRLGLAQLYQLRGRVGRGAERAYAYLLYDRNARLTEAAQKRLQTIFEATELGAGFQIAMRDLEIRGAGNLLGPEQSGHMAAVGLDLYTRLLSEQVERLRALRRGETPKIKETTQASVTLPIAAYIPDDYVIDLNQRLNLYQRLANFTNVDEVNEIEKEMQDRFGRPPRLVLNLLYIVALRILAQQAGVEAIALESEQVVLRMREQKPLPREALRRELAGKAAVGRTQVRVDYRPNDYLWQGRLFEVLERLAAFSQAAA